jgi:vacuolar-type H+-ATPase subunit I/STV1
MGVFIWHQWARFVTITASVYSTWAGFWAIFYRKFFWDFVGGTIRAPGGVQAPPSAAPFVAVIVKAPVIQIFAMVLAILILVLELPAPFVKGTAVHRSFMPRVVLLVVQAFLGFLYYQGTNGAIWSVIGIIGYSRAMALGEMREELKANRGKGGAA